MNCAQARSLISPYLDGRLDGAAGSGFERHCAACAECARILDETRGAQNALSGTAPSPLPAGYLERLGRKLDERPAGGLARRLVPLLRPLAGVAMVLIGLVIWREYEPERLTEPRHRAVPAPARIARPMMQDPSDRSSTAYRDAPSAHGFSMAYISAAPGNDPARPARQEMRAGAAAQEAGAPREARHKADSRMTMQTAAEAPDPQYDRNAMTPVYEAQQEQDLNGTLDGEPDRSDSMIKKEVRTIGPKAMNDASGSPRGDGSGIVMRVPQAQAPAANKLPLGSHYAHVHPFRGEIWTGNSYQQGPELQLAIRDTKQWNAVWAAVERDGKHPPEIDFSTHMVIAVFASSRRSAGRRIFIDTLALGETEIVVGYYESSLPSDDASAQKLERPYHMMTMQASDLPVRFERLRH